jgi:hypothetical protein
MNSKLALTFVFAAATLSVAICSVVQAQSTLPPARQLLGGPKIESWTGLHGVKTKPAPATAALKVPGEATFRYPQPSGHEAEAPVQRELRNWYDAFGVRFEVRLDNATFVNTGRGRTVNHADLLAFLPSRPDVTALLDVTDPEPLPLEHPLRALPLRLHQQPHRRQHRKRSSAHGRHHHRGISGMAARTASALCRELAAVGDDGLMLVSIQHKDDH